MKTHILAVIAASTIATAPALAQQFNGATLGLAYQDVGGDGGDFEVTSLSGGLEFGVTQNFAIGANVETIGSDDFIDDIFVGTIRGIYNSSPNSAVGAFYSVENVDDFETTLYGIEGAFTSANSMFNAYLGAADSDAFGDLDVLGVAGFGFEFGVGAGVSLGLEYESYRVEDFLLVVDTGDIEDANITDTALTARYSFLDGASVYAKAGRIRAFGSDREANVRIVGVDSSEYITVGAEYKFGRGALFDARSLRSFGG
ncbi:hypothetical protein QTO30_04785 [Yoonia sp. GPGPB17]|uniref:hypothetical protein n=1 Tax=Yoonia sp. GPGPB17 TaxID=3026147 RepID=UPI0030C25E36